MPAAWDPLYALSASKRVRWANTALVWRHQLQLITHECWFIKASIRGAHLSDIILHRVWATIVLDISQVAHIHTHRLFPGPSCFIGRYLLLTATSISHRGTSTSDSGGRAMVRLSVESYRYLLATSGLDWVRIKLRMLSNSKGGIKIALQRDETKQVAHVCSSCSILVYWKANIGSSRTIIFAFAV